MQPTHPPKRRSSANCFFLHRKSGYRRSAEGSHLKALAARHDGHSGSRRGEFDWNYPARSGPTKVRFVGIGQAIGRAARKQSKCRAGRFKIGNRAHSSGRSRAENDREISSRRSAAPGTICHIADGRAPHHHSGRCRQRRPAVFAGRQANHFHVESLRPVANLDERRRWQCSGASQFYRQRRNSALVARWKKHCFRWAVV